MITQSTMTELQSMPLDDLRREVRGKREALAKLRLGVEMQKEKDTAKYRREKKMLSRMLMVLGEKSPKGPKGPRVPTLPKGSRHSSSSGSSVPSAPSVSSPQKRSALKKATKTATLPPP